MTALTSRGRWFPGIIIHIKEGPAVAHLQKWHVVQRAHLGTVRGCTSTQRTFSLVSNGRLYSNLLSRS